MRVRTAGRLSRLSGHAPQLGDDLLILVPVLRRPHNVAPLLASIEHATPQPYRVLFISDPDDQAEQAAVAAAGAELLIVDGNYATKINTAAAAATAPMLFLGADDLRFHPGWLQAAAARFTGRIAVVGTNDLGNRRVIAGRHATHSLVASWYIEHGTIDEPGKLLHEAYPHEFVDDEFVGTAKHRQTWAHAADSHVEHLHPNWGKAPTDPLYDAEPERMRTGRIIYRQRRRLWTRL